MENKKSGRQPQIRSRNWLGTYNNPKPEFIIEYLEKWHTIAKARYVCGQLEKAPTTGTIHIQFFMNFEQPASLAALKKHCNVAHFEQVKVDNGAASYCMKQETRVDGPWEYGTKPVQRNNKEDWETVWQLAKEGKIE